MAKVKSAFFCQNCGAQHPKWMGRCSQCGEWNTLVEEILQRDDSKTPWRNSGSAGTKKAAKPMVLDSISTENLPRIVTPDAELNRVLGGGIVPGSLILMGGEPGIGKSTLSLQLALALNELKVLYVSGEESAQQIKLRAERLGGKNSQLFVLTETKTQDIFREIEALEPHLVLIDSIQTLQTDLLDASPGSLSQIRECAGEFMKFAKETQTPVILIGHITKDGTLAGPKVLEHMVDVVLQFEGDRNHVYRLLRAHKNRFGSTNELGIYEMQGSGLQEVSNPSAILLSKNEDHLSGIAVTASLEGMRPILLEIQALVSTAVYGTPQRSSTGFDTRRLNMLLAVLEKRCGFRLGAKDVFLNVTGGLRMDDPAADLAVVAAILSSNEDMALPDKVCFAAEVGLAGEVRAVQRVDQRISEAQKLGFETIFISRHNKIKPSDFAIRVVAVGKIEEVFQHLFG